MTPRQIDLNIRAESVQQVYDWYVEGRLVVNRRYQRKLVWKKSEKQKLINTLINNYPMPLILIANYDNEDGRLYELIDGMQRLDAIFSFIENKYDYEGKYYDTSVMATSNIAVREGILKPSTEQNLESEICKFIANYKIPISEYKIEDSEQVDEIFRRINSNGKALSRQELRQAGVIGRFSDIVRELSTGIRGDVSHNNIISLNKMSEISLSSDDLAYGIDVNKIFWVKSGILVKDGIRDSKDESLIADLVVNIVNDHEMYTSEVIIDSYYGRPADSGDAAIDSAEAIRRELDLKINQMGDEILMESFLKTYDEIQKICDMGKTNFRHLIGIDETRHSITRYYSAVFWSFYKIMIDENKKVKDYKNLIASMKNIASSVDVKTGGTWAAYIKKLNISLINGIIQNYFEDNTDDPASKSGITEFENIILKANTEASSYDFKQGFHRLESDCQIDNSAFDKILHTICGIANEGKNNIGYVILGVCDKETDADRIKTLFGKDSIRVGGYLVAGVDHEVENKYQNLDNYIHLISDKIVASPLSPDISKETASSIKTLDYKGKTVVITRVKASSNICFYGDKCYMRNANRTQEASVTDMPLLLRRFS